MAAGFRRGVCVLGGAVKETAEAQCSTPGSDTMGLGLYSEKEEAAFELVL